VEILVNFLSRYFLRAVRPLLAQISADGPGESKHERVLYWNRVAGGTYWQKIVADNSISENERVDQLAESYTTQLRRWFQYVVHFPIRARYKHVPRYHMVFGTRHIDGIELMNQAMVRARRDLVGSQFIVGRLFPDEPQSEVVDPKDVKKLVLETSGRVGKTTWKMLRVSTTIAYPCKYNKMDFNRAIKGLIQEHRLGSTCSGKRIEENASVWPST
jgi:hypothetical protein